MYMICKHSVYVITFFSEFIAYAKGREGKKKA